MLVEDNLACLAEERGWSPAKPIKNVICVETQNYLDTVFLRRLDLFQNMLCSTSFELVSLTIELQQAVTWKARFPTFERERLYSK